MNQTDPDTGPDRAAGLLRSISRREAPDDELLGRRVALAELLEKQHEESPEAADRRALENLRRPGQPLLVSGQQAGLLLGPAYSLHKILGLLTLAEALSAAGLPRPVCIFWIESNDHDWEEIARIRVPGFKDLKLAPPPGGRGRSVGRIRLEEESLETLRRGLAAVFETWPAEQRSICEDGLRRPGSPAELFRRLARGLFPGRGLLFFDPSTPGARRLCAPFFEGLRARGGALLEDFRESTGQLRAEGQEPPVTLDELAPWFEEDGLGLRRRARFDSEPASPDALSSNVLSRPLLQDWLLAPDLCLAGPGELLYLRQTEAAARGLGIRGALPWPRPRVQLVPIEDEERFRALELDPWNPPQPGEPWPAEFLDRLPGASAGRNDQRRLLELAQEIFKLGADWSGRAGRPDLEASGKRLGARLTELGDKIFRASIADHRPLLRDLHRRARWQDSTAGPQERRINSLALLAHLGGPKILPALEAALDPFAGGSQRLLVDPGSATVRNMESEA